MASHEIKLKINTHPLIEFLKYRINKKIKPIKNKAQKRHLKKAQKRHLKKDTKQTNKYILKAPCLANISRLSVFT